MRKSQKGKKKNGHRFLFGTWTGESNWGTEPPEESLLSALIRLASLRPASLAKLDADHKSGCTSAPFGGLALSKRDVPH